MFIEIYSKPDCPFCAVAKKFFDTKNLSYKEYVLNVDYVKQDLLDRLKLPSNYRLTVPQIFVEDNSIGGSEDLAVKFQNLVDYLHLT